MGNKKLPRRWREAETAAGFLSGLRKCLRQSCLMGVGWRRLGCFHVSWTPLAVPPDHPAPVLSAPVTHWIDLHSIPRHSLEQPLPNRSRTWLPRHIGPLPPGWPHTSNPIDVSTSKCLIRSPPLRERRFPIGHPKHRTLPQPLDDLMELPAGPPPPGWASWVWLLPGTH